MKKIACIVTLLAMTASAKSPVVVELFTSQGCSSCPPAENLIDFLHEKFRGEIIPLTFHVDYWNDGGWKDTFSSPEATQRQRVYRQALRDENLYTPEMVVQGEVGFLGSDRWRAEKEIRSRLESERPEIGLEVQHGSPSTVRVTLPDEVARQSRSLSVVIYEQAPSVKVTAGENERQLMSGDFVVRHITTLSDISGSQFEVPLELDPSWAVSKTGVAVLVQGSGQHILAAQARYPLE